MGKKSVFGKSKEDGEDDDDDDEDDDSTSEEEDDAAVLATEAVDNEIMATLNAIRSKDPRVYDPNTKFFTSIDEDTTETGTEKQEAKPMYLRDYHRQNLLSRANGEADEGEEEAPRTYAQEQEELKQAIVKEMHAAGDSNEDENEGSDDDAFLVKKHKEENPDAAIKITEEDVAAADKDPETFLSNFMASRAWVPTERSNWAPLESDDDEEDARAEAFEEAYNFRFEDPNKINERLITHARDTTSKYSVRREEPSSRKKKREAERQRREEEKRQLEEEKARLRKLKIEQLEEKVAKIKQAAGIKADDIPDEDWARFLDNDWDDEKWEKEMNKRFNDDYYAEREGDDDDEDGPSKKKKKVKKPTWDDDIDIKDLVPDFEDDEAGAVGSDEDEEMEDADGEPKPKSKKDRLREKKDKQKEARKERRKIEAIVDQNLNLETSLLPGNKKKFSGTFRYRESSPLSFGLTARDILFADDAELNKFAGLKKLASFRDPAKKKKDRKHLGKKARLRQWRLDTFGNEDGPVIPEPSAAAAEEAPSKEPEEMKVDIREGKKRKRKRSKKN